jgi:CDP-diacylglycerol--glycerol-3-phosphate 3-phosphatidyltransferase
MISTYQLKSRFQCLLRPLATWLFRRGVTANQVTLASCLLSLVAGVFVAANIEHKQLILLIFIWSPLRMAANAMDGMLAREFAQASRLGAVLNEVGDVISDIALYMPFALIAGSNAWLLAAVVLLAVLGEFAGVLGAALGGERGYHGPMGKSDRALLFSMAALLLGCGVPIAAYLDWLWAAMIVMLMLTIANRCRAAANHGGQP